MEKAYKFMTLNYFYHLT